MEKVLSNKWVIFLLITPGFIIFLFAIIAPIIYSLYLGGTDWTGVGVANFVGMENYKQVITRDSVFYQSLLNASVLAIATIGVQHPFAILMAAMVDKLGGKWEKVYRTIYFIPCVISVVVVSKLWVAVLDPKYGILNKFLTIIGLEEYTHAWLSDPKTSMISIILIVMWQGFGYAFLLYYSGIKGVSKDLFEAARIDGAGAVKIYTKVVIPLIQPIMKVCITMALIASFKQMEIVYLTTDGGPGNTTQFIANYLYKTAFQSYEYGYANAISVVFVIFCLVVTLIFNKVYKVSDI